MLRTTCPECGEPVEFGENAQVSERIVCVECRVELEIPSLSPLAIDYVLTNGWEDDWDAGDDLGVRWDDD